MTETNPTLPSQSCAKKHRTTKELAEEATKAMSDLNMFYAIKALCESSLFSTASHPDEGRIVAICIRGSARCLKRYDAAMTALEAKPR